MIEFTCKYYSAYGLKIKSEINLPELNEIDTTNFDVTVSYGNVPSKIENPVKIGVAFQAKQNEFLLNVPDIADYFVKNGNEIIVSKKENVSNSEINLFLLGSAFGAVLYQQKKVPFHGSTVIINNKAIIISGVSGAGKSTIVASLTNKNYPLLSDDVTVLKEKNGNIIAISGFPQVKLWQDSLDMMNISAKNLIKIRPQLEKYKFPVKNFVEGQKQVDSIFILTKKNTKNVEIEEIKGIEKFKILANNTYRKQFVSALKLEKEQFKIISLLAAKTKLYFIKRPNGINTIDEISNLIIEKTLTC